MHHIYFSQCTCYVVRGRTLGIHQGERPTSLRVVQYVGEGTMPLASLFGSHPTFFHFPHFPLADCAFSGAASWVGGFVYVLGPCGSLQQTPVRLGVSTSTATPTGFYSQKFWGFIFPCWNPGLHGLSRSTVIPPALFACKCGATQSANCHLAGSPLSPGFHLCPFHQSEWMFLL